jgi:hypothetical protein
MSTRTNSVSIVLITLLAICSSSDGDDSLSSPFINSLGKHSLFDGKLTIHMVEKDDFVIYKFEEAEKAIKTDAIDGKIKITSSPSKPRIKKGAKWFIFPVSKNEVWIYEGGDDLTLYKAIDPEGRRALNNGVFLMADQEHNIVKKAPKEVLDRLPKAMKEKYGIK